MSWKEQALHIIHIFVIWVWLKRKLFRRICLIISEEKYYERGFFRERRNHWLVLSLLKKKISHIYFDELLWKLVFGFGRWVFLSIWWFGRHKSLSKPRKSMYFFLNLLQKSISLSCDHNDDVDDYYDDCLLRVMADRFGLWPFAPTIKVALLSYRIVNVVVVWNSQASLKSSKLWWSLSPFFLLK